MSRHAVVCGLVAIVLSNVAPTKRLEGSSMVSRQERLVHAGVGPPRYGLTAIVLHWISALLIVVVGILGLLHDNWPKRTQGFWINVHATLGLLVWALVIVRVSWRFR